MCLNNFSKNYNITLHYFFLVDVNCIYDTFINQQSAMILVVSNDIDGFIRMKPSILLLTTSTQKITRLKTISFNEKEVFIKLLRLVNQGMFLYKDKLYQQHDGVSMGSPLAPTLANFFLLT